jgi:hypothetical protein
MQAVIFIAETAELTLANLGLVVNEKGVWHGGVAGQPSVHQIFLE